MMTRPDLTATVPPDAVISPDRTSPLALEAGFCITRSRLPFPPTVRFAETVTPDVVAPVVSALLVPAPLSRVSDPPDRARVEVDALVLLKPIWPTVMGVSTDTVPNELLNVAVAPTAFG